MSESGLALSTMYVSRYGPITDLKAPLKPLLSKKTKFRWDAEFDEAFHNSKTTIKSCRKQEIACRSSTRRAERVSTKNGLSQELRPACANSMPSVARPPHSSSGTQKNGMSPDPSPLSRCSTFTLPTTTSHRILDNWFRFKGLKANAEKTQLMLFGRKQNCVHRSPIQC